MKMASINKAAGKYEDNEEVLERCVEKSQIVYGKDYDKIYDIKNNLMKYYIEFNVDKAVKYGSQVAKEKELIQGISTYNSHDLHYTLATAMSLEGTMNQDAIKGYEECLKLVD
jgi:tetratricopeptide (TPR) repeat protein